jgi:hypothetical protein
MENAMYPSDEIRRHPSGSAEIDFYRQNAIASRRQAMREARVLRAASAGTLVVAGVLGLVFTTGVLRTVADQMAEASFQASQTR